MVDQVSEWPSAGNEVAALLAILTTGVSDSDMAGDDARGKRGSDRSGQNYQRHPLASHVDLQIDPFRTGVRLRANSAASKQTTVTVGTWPARDMRGHLAPTDLVSLSEVGEVRGLRDVGGVPVEDALRVRPDRIVKFVRVHHSDAICLSKHARF
jgi:hypothetical protein